MLPSIATLSSICEDACQSGQMEQYEIKPLNRQFVQDDFYNRTIQIYEGNTEQSTLNQTTTNNFKQLFRTLHMHIAHPSRTSLWFNLLHHDHIRSQNKFQQAVERYPDDVRNMFGRRNDIIVRLPSCVDPNHLPHYYLNRRGQHAVTRILSIFAYYHPDVTWAPLLGPLTALFLHYMTEIHAYESLLILTSNDFKVITQTEIQYQSLTHAFCALLRRHCRSTYDILSKQSQQTSIFDDWLWIIFEYLPFNYLIPIIDCLLIEDMKILIRISMSLYHFFVKYGLNQQTFINKPRRRSSIFRRSKFSRTSRRSQTNLSIFSSPSKKVTINVREQLIAYIEHFDLPIEKVFKHAFGIHHLQRKVIFRTMEIEEEKIKLERRSVISSLQRSSSTNDHQITNLVSLPKTISTRGIQHQNSMPIIMVREFDTTTASHSDFAYLWSFIPNRLADLQPERIYSSNIHGRRLRTLYDHVEYHEYCLIIIRNEHQQIFGGFCSEPLANRTKTRTWFGTGESFLFTLKPERQIYKWVGYQTSNKGNTKAYEDYFIFANDDCLQMGGSEEPMNIGLRIEHDLNEGYTKACDTFANQPLSSDEHFQIMEIEVFGFTC